MKLCGQIGEVGSQDATFLLLATACPQDEGLGILAQEPVGFEGGTEQ